MSNSTSSPENEPSAPTKLLSLTDQQRAAIETKHVSVALSAGAGCGKTFVLTRRFLSHLQPGPDRLELHEIAAITFTDRAAREMRNRVREACLNELRTCPAEQVDHWLSMLRNLESARISTIHSFCSRLIRSSAIELDFDPQFGLLDPAAAQTLLRESARDVVWELLESEDEDIVQLVLRYGMEDARARLADIVEQRFRIDLGGLVDRTPEDLAADWKATWKREVVPTMLDDFLRSSIVTQVRQLFETFEAESPKIIEKRGQVFNSLNDLGDAADPATVLEQLHEHCKMPRGAKVWPDLETKERFQTAFDQIRGDIKKLRERLGAASDDDTTQFAAELTRAAVQCAQKIASEYDTRKRHGAMVDFDDLLLQTRNLLRDNASLRSRLANGIKLLMVDEFQDTDPLQAEIVRFLCGNRLTTGKLFLVGDVKQSIYRFRRADPAVFREMRAEIPAEGRLPLMMNFRSQPAVLDFVNFIFADAMDIEYDPLTSPLKGQVSPGPAIEFLFAMGDADATETETAGVLRNREADWMARRISALLNDPTPKIRAEGTGELRPVQAGDIVILFRALSEVARYEDALRKQDIEYYLVGGRAFYAQQEVYDVINLCSAVQNPNDAIALTGVLRSPFFSVTDDALFAIGQSDGALFEALQDAPPGWLTDDEQTRLRFAAATLRDLREQKDRLPISELLERAIDRTGYDAALLLEHLGRRKVANLHKLIELARSLEDAGLFTMSRFVEQMQTFVQDETHEELASMFPEKSDVVRLMTIHQSKGLEFPVVFVADLNRQQITPRAKVACDPTLGPVLSLPPLRGNSRTHLAREIWKWQQARADEAESLRVLYVAMTRAADYLILSGGLDAKRSLKSDWLKLLASRFDLETGLPVVDPYFGTASGGMVDPARIPEILVHRRRPSVPTTQGSRTKLRALSKLRDDVVSADPDAVPPLAVKLTATATMAQAWSVSRVEQLVAEAQSSMTSAPIPEFTPGSAWLDDAADPTTADQRGTLIHAVLEHATVEQRDHVPELVAKMAGLLGISVPAAFLDDLARRVARYLDSSTAAMLAAARQVLREVDFSLPWQLDDRPTLIVGQIDALFEREDGSWGIVDYKTGRHARHAAAEELAKTYDVQCLLYTLAVERYCGFPVTSVELIVVEDEIRRIPWSRSPEERAQLERAITTAIQES